jgi:hypothetical protein
MTQSAAIPNLGLAEHEGSEHAPQQRRFVNATPAAAAAVGSR